MVSRKIKPVEQNPTNLQPRHELLQATEIVAREKGIEVKEVLEAMELAIQRAAKAKYGTDRDISVKIDPVTGDTVISHTRVVVETVSNENAVREITLTEAKKLDPNAEIGNEIVERLPAIDIDRGVAKAARPIMQQKMREIERSYQYNEFKDRVGEIVSGVVRRSEFGNTIVDLIRAEGFLKRDNTIPREIHKLGDKIRVFISEINLDNRGPIVVLSRTHPQFMAKLFEQEVPEIYEGIIQIKSVARDPGSRAKMAVYTADPSIDPVGACVGMRGTRVQAVTNELQGEKVDIIPWSPEPATFVVNALAPAEVIKVVIDEDAKRVSVIVAEDQLSLAIGRRGQNVRLASQLTGWNIDIVTEEEEVKRRASELSSLSQKFIDALDIDEMIAHLLIAEGFTSVEEITQVDAADFSAIEGFDLELAEELKSRADAFLVGERQRINVYCEDHGIDAVIASIDGLSIDILGELARVGIKTWDKLADLSSDELIEIIGKAETLELEKANQIIMAARAHWPETDKQ